MVDAYPHGVFPVESVLLVHSLSSGEYVQVHEIVLREGALDVAIFCQEYQNV